MKNKSNWKKYSTKINNDFDHHQLLSAASKLEDMVAKDFNDYEIYSTGVQVFGKDVSFNKSKDGWEVSMRVKNPKEDSPNKIGFKI